MPDALPAPLTPPDCDLRDFPKLMIDINRLFSSTFNAKASRNPLAWMIGHKLWYRSWHQVPAASLPDDDDELCYLAEMGFDVKSFRKAKELAMHGWIKCADGRLYHATVAEAALSAWESKRRRIHSTECGRIKKHNQRHGTAFAAPTFEDFVASGCRPLVLTSAAGEATIFPWEKRGVSPTTDDGCPRGQSQHVPGDTGGLSPGNEAPREREEREKRDSNKRPSVSLVDEERVDPSQVQLPVLADQPDAVQIAFDRHDEMRREFLQGARAVELTVERRKKLTAALKKIGGLPAWDEALTIVRGNRFLRGETSRKAFPATLDWMLGGKDFNNLRDLREGNYDDNDRHHADRDPHGGPPRRTRSAVDAVSFAVNALGAGG